MDEMDVPPSPNYTSTWKAQPFGVVQLVYIEIEELLNELYINSAYVWM